jgi:hypothetical protein
MQVPWWQSPQAEIRPTTIRLWRPLLEEPKSTIDAYVAASGIRPILDESNAATDFTRNAIRHQVMPTLERVFPAAKSSVTRFAEIARAEDELLSALTETALSVALRDDGSIDLAALLSEDVAIRRRVLIRWLRSQTGTTEISFERVQAVLDLAESMKEGPIVEIPLGHSVTVIGAHLFAGTAGELLDIAWSQFPGPRIEPTVLLPVALRAECVTRIGRTLFRMSEGSVPERGDTLRWTTIPPASGAILVRRLRSDDRWSMSGKRVHDALRRQRVPAIIRDQIVGVAGENGVFWIPGLVPTAASGDEQETSVTVSWGYDE